MNTNRFHAISRFVRRHALLLRLAISAGAVVWLVSSFRWVDMAYSLSGVRWPVVGAAWAIFMLSLICCTVRWQRLLDACGYPIAVSESASAYLVGSFFGAFLPTGRGGDIVRALVVARRRQYSTGGVIATVFVERLIGALVALGLVLSVAPLAASRLGALRPTLVYMGVLGAGALMIVAIAGSPPMRRAVGRAFDGIAHRRFGAAVQDVLHVLGVVQRDPRLIASQVGLSLLNQLALVVSGYVLTLAIPGFEVPWFATLIVTPLVFFTGVMPSVGGYGVREAGYVLTWSWFGVSGGAAGVYGLSQLLFLWSLSLSGALLFAAGGSDVRLTKAGTSDAVQTTPVVHHS